MNPIVKAYAMIRDCLDDHSLSPHDVARTLAKVRYIAAWVEELAPEDQALIRRQVGVELIVDCGSPLDVRLVAQHSPIHAALLQLAEGDAFP